MTSTVAQVVRGTEANSLPSRARAAKVGLDAQGTPGKNTGNRPERGSFRPLVSELLRRPTYTRKGFVEPIGIGQPDLADALAGPDRKRFDIDWLAAQDDAFLLDFIELVIAARELTPEAKRLIRANQMAEMTRLMHLMGERRDERRGA